MDQTYSTNNEELPTILKKRGQPFAQQFFVKPCAKVQGKRASRSGTGPQGTSQYYSYLFRFKLTIKILLTLFLPLS